MNIYRERAQNMIRALRESPDPTQFTMGCWTTRCGTPACVLGHYAARSDLQNIFELRADYYLDFFVAHIVGGAPITYGSGYSGELLDHFGLTQSEAFLLFNVTGCDNARTPDEAIVFIQNFMDKKWPEPPAQKLIDELNRIETPEVAEVA